LSHKLDKFYSSFAGLDTRSNKLLANPKSFRDGSKNFRYNFQDEITKANGFQHKSAFGFTSVGDIEYRYTDIDTGEARSQYLSVGTDGNLYKKRLQYIKFSSLGTATSYSFYYDENADTYKLKFNSYAAINVSLTMTMDELRVAINALGATCTVVDEDGTTISGSTKLAYLIDVVMNKELSLGVANEMNSQYWEKVLSGGGYTDIPFTTTRDFYTDPNYNGISYVNINNVCIITDGGFPMKYDGYVVYRVGQPKILAPRQQSEPDYSFAGTNYNYTGIFLTPTSRPDGNMSPNGEYQYVFQIGSVDAQGNTVMGGFDVGAENLYIKQRLPRGYNAMSIVIPSLTASFNWFRCRVRGGQNIPNGGATIDVYPNHNLVAGLTARIPLSNRQLTAYFGNASITNASAVVTGLNDTSRIKPGHIVSGTNIPANTIVSSVDSSTQITISNAATATATIANLQVDRIDGFSYLMSKIISASYGYSGSAVVTNGSAVVTGISDTSTIEVGALVGDGTFFPVGTRVLSIDSATQITADASATFSSSSVDVYGLVLLQKGYDETEYSTVSLQYPFQAFVESQILGTTSGSNLASVFASFAGTITSTAGSNTATIASTDGIMVGMYLSHANFSNGTTVTEVVDATTFKLSTNATGSGAVFGNFRRNLVGYYIQNPNVPEGTQVTGQDSTNVTMTNNATGTGSLYGSLYKENTLLINGQTLSAGFVVEQYQNIITDLNLTDLFLPEVFAGSFLRIWRTTKDTDLLYHLIDIDIPLVQYTFVDTFADTAAWLGSTQPAPWTLSRLSLTDADQGGELPRACKYVSKWQNQIIQMGRPVDTSLKDETYPTFTLVEPLNDWGDPLTTFIGSTYTEAALCDYQSIYWNSSSSSEAFPRDGLHEFKIESPFDDEIRGGAQNKDAFFAFKERSTGVLVGSLAENTIQLELLEADVGLASHRSIQEINGSLVWLDAVNGFYSCVAGRLPINIGFPIVDYQKINSTNLDWTKAVSANFRKENLYICAVEGTTFVFDYANEGSLQRNCWYLWDRFVTSGLTATAEDELYLSDGTRQWKMKLTNTKYDFTDHTSAINFVLKTAWLTQGAPTIDKQYINLWVNSIQGDFTLNFNQYQNFLDYSISDITNVQFLAESSSKKLVKVQYKAANPKISGVSFGMSNNEKNAYVRIQGYEIEYVVAFDSGEPKK